VRQRYFAARYLCGDRYQQDAAAAPVEEEDSGPLNLSTPYPITLSRVALHNVNVKIDDTAVSVRDFSTGLNWQEKNLTLTPTSLQGLLIALPKVAKVAQEQVVEPKIDNPQPEENRSARR
jgi:translocation and assembly module TamB